MRLIPNHPYDITSLECYLNKMAKKGYLVKRIRGPFASFMKFQSTDLHYKIVPIRENINFLVRYASPSAKEKRINESHGWFYVCDYLGLFRIYASVEHKIFPMKENKQKLLKIGLFHLFTNVIFAAIFIALFNSVVDHHIYTFMKNYGSFLTIGFWLFIFLLVLNGLLSIYYLLVKKDRKSGMKRRIGYLISMVMIVASLGILVIRNYSELTPTSSYKPTYTTLKPLVKGYYTTYSLDKESSKVNIYGDPIIYTEDWMQAATLTTQYSESFASLHIKYHKSIFNFMINGLAEEYMEGIKAKELKLKNVDYAYQYKQDDVTTVLFVKNKQMVWVQFEKEYNIKTKTWAQKIANSIE